MESKPIAIWLSDKLRMDVAAFRGEVYFHMHDTVKRKSVTLRKPELFQMFKKREEILNARKRLELKEATKPEATSSKRRKQTVKKDHREDDEDYSSPDDCNQF